MGNEICNGCGMAGIGAQIRYEPIHHAYYCFRCRKKYTNTYPRYNTCKNFIRRSKERMAPPRELDGLPDDRMRMLTHLTRLVDGVYTPICGMPLDTLNFPALFDEINCNHCQNILQGVS